MQKEFWLSRWKEGATGFHGKEVNEHLETWIEHAQLKKGATIFVPLCGKSLDLLWLAGLKFKVIGVELSSLAIEQFFDENDLQAEVRTMGNFTLYTAYNLHIICGDFFELETSQLGEVDFVYDRAALIALPEEMRVKYIEKMGKLVSPEVSTLLITLEYPQPEMSGPPFSVSEQELKKYYSKITLLESNDVLQKHKKFFDRGVESLTESVWYVGGL